MFRYKTKKQAYIIAALVILLCLVCLVGATLALFTSDLKDGTIGIITTTGDVEVDLVDALTGESLVGQTLTLQTDFVHREILFEPGATYHTQGFKIKNNGTVPINFRLSISEDEDISMKDFYDAFDVWIATDKNSQRNPTDISEFIREGIAPEHESDETYFLFIKMKESVGNEFQNKTYSGIGVTVYAVQGNAIIKE